MGVAMALGLLLVALVIVAAIIIALGWGMVQVAHLGFVAARGAVRRGRS